MCSVIMGHHLDSSYVFVSRQLTAYMYSNTYINIALLMLTKLWIRAFEIGLKKLQ